MTARHPLGISAMGLITPLGTGPVEVAKALFRGTIDGFVRRDDLCPGRTLWVGACGGDLPQSPAEALPYESRNSRLMLAAVEQIRHPVERAIGRHGPDRIGVILGSSTGGISDHETARQRRAQTGEWPTASHYHQWELGTLSDYVALVFGVTGPAYTIATACSASAKVFASGRRLIESGACDAVIVGGADTLCRMTLAGFSSLEAVAPGLCNPFSRNRDGLNIGEGAAAFLLTKDDAPVRLLGAGECSDAYHVSAPQPDGEGALRAMRLALEDASLRTDEVAYINLHGTATPLNDAMEAKAVAELFGSETPCSSTKAMMGHALGAAGACEAAFLWLTLHSTYNPDNYLPPHLWDGVADPDLPTMDLVKLGARFAGNGPVAMLSNSFAFGGNNVVLAFGRAAS